MIGWHAKTLGDSCDLIARGIAPRYVESGGIRVLNQKCIRDHTINYAVARRHNPGARTIAPDRLIRVGDVLVNSTGEGTLGRVAQVRDEPDEPTIVDTHITIVRPKRGMFEPDFFGFAMIQIEDQIAASGEGASGQTELSRSKLSGSFRVSYPESLVEQRRIVAILDEAFERIAIATASTEKNLANARELFDIAFNKLLSEDADNWREVTLKEVCAITSKLVDPRLQNYIDLPHVGAGNMESRTGALANVLTAREEGLISAKFAFDQSMVLYSKIRPYLMKACRPDFAGLCSADVYPLSPKAEVLSRDFLFYVLLTRSFTAYAESGSARAGMPKVNRDHLFAYRLKLPPIKKQEEIAFQVDALAATCDRLVASCQVKLAALIALKQSLLQFAFSGQPIGTELLAA